MKIISFNVNGLNSAVNKGLLNFIEDETPDILCLQETKCQNKILNLTTYYSYWNFSNKGSFSGTAIFTKYKPINVYYNFDDDFNVEGRIITLEYHKFYLINVYIPNSKSNNIRLDYRMEWDDRFFKYILKLENNKPVILCGDFNVAIKEEDTNQEESVFLNNEVIEFISLLDLGFIDTFRYKHGNVKNAFTWWNINVGNKELNVGSRLDYFLVSNYFKKYINDSVLKNEINISDHCPIILDIGVDVD